MRRMALLTVPLLLAAACGGATTTPQGSPITTPAGAPTTGAVEPASGGPTPPPTVGRAWPSALEGYTSTTFTLAGILAPASSVRSMAVAADGTLWAVPERRRDRSSAIGSFDGETWTTYGEAEGLPSGKDPDVFSVDIAPDGSVWAGTSDGVARFDGETWTTWGKEDGLPSDLPLEVVVVAAPDGTVWAAWPWPGPWPGGDSDPKGGVARFDGSAWTTWDGVPDMGLLDFTPDLDVGRDGTVWVYMGPASWLGPNRGGLARFDGTAWTMVDEWVDYWAWTGYPLAVGPDGTVWFGAALYDDRLGVSRFAGGPGVSRFDGSTWTAYTTEDGIAPGLVRAATFAPDGRLWITTGTGLSSFDGETWTQDPLEVDAFAAGHDGTLWAAVGLNLVRFTPR